MPTQARANAVANKPPKLARTLMDDSVRWLPSLNEGLRRPDSPGSGEGNYGSEGWGFESLRAHSEVLTVGSSRADDWDL